MENHVTIKRSHGNGLISSSEIIDLLDLFYKNDSSKFEINFPNGSDPKSKRGWHLYKGKTKSGLYLHEIFIYEDQIKKDILDFLPMGGNRISPNEKIGTAMVLVHEMRHADQAMTHLMNNGSGGAFYLGKYKARPCEVDARRYVDENFEAIVELFSDERMIYDTERSEQSRMEV